MIEDFIEEICLFLDIDIANVSTDTSTFATNTMMAQYVSSDNAIRVKDVTHHTPDLMFAIAHELRHAWQIKYHEEMLDGYKSSSELSVEEYNLQPAEVDANAFAMITMEDIFNMTPKFNNMTDKVKRSIIDRVAEIRKES